MQVRKKYKVEKSDFLDFNYYVAKIRSISCIPLIIVFIIITLHMSSGNKNILEHITTIESILAFIMIIPSFYFVARRQTNKDYADSNEWIELVLNNNGLFQSTDGETYYIIYFHSIKKVFETKNGIYVKISKSVLTIPKRYFSEYELDAMREIFLANMPKRKVKLKKKD